jgi:hypothetical protein
MPGKNESKESDLSNPQNVQDLIAMVASFTLIGN